MAQSVSSRPAREIETAISRCTAIREHMRAANLFAPISPSASVSGTLTGYETASWRISPSPLLLTRQQMAFFTELGPRLLSFYRALNRLYYESAKGIQPAWVSLYLDQGKPEGLVTYSRMKRFRDALPAVIRPDVIPTDNGMIITELDSVQGGIGLTAALSHAYADVNRQPSTVKIESVLDSFSYSPPHSSAPAQSFLPTNDASRFTLGSYEVIGGRNGMVQGFASMLQTTQKHHAGVTAIVVSEEAKDYRPEMTWLADQLRKQGLPVWCVEPRQILFTEDGLRLRTDDGEQAIGLIYRFYELFDLPNIPKAELVQYAVKKNWVAVTPPYKPALEEKLAFALLHHPILRPYWEKELGADCFMHLTAIMPKTWVLDPAPIPPTATIPHLHLGARAVANWTDLATATQKERHFVIKPSGFSELAWGSRGVSIGHDLPQKEWADTLHNALTSFPATPYLMQEFHKGQLFEIDYMDESTQTIVRMAGRARLSPYYFLTSETVELAGILATVCPADKKILHGMKDAILVPCAISSDSQ